MSTNSQAAPCLRSMHIRHTSIPSLGGGVCFLAVEFEGVHVGNAGLKNIHNGKGEIWYYIGDESWRGKGIATALVAELIDYSRDLCLEALYARVLENNVGSRRVLEKNGFQLASDNFGLHKGMLMLKYERTIKSG
ncbi:GNAT family N-acetyltransferase [Eggerthella sinensis]|uniref:GNAT family N-acetyltransferase n=1 Tax=Eggerthella sinensis TaxID=242230 RepID=UPI002FD83D9B